jgi:hypothetical protein
MTEDPQENPWYAPRRFDGALDVDKWVRWIVAAVLLVAVAIYFLRTDPPPGEAGPGGPVSP